MTRSSQRPAPRAASGPLAWLGLVLLAGACGDDPGAETGPGAGGGVDAGREPSAVHAAARAAMARGDLAAAEADYAWLLARDERWPGASLELGELLAGNGYPQRAEPLLRHAARIAPDDVAPRLALGRLLLFGAQPEAARPPLEEAVLLAPENAEAWRMLADARRGAGDLEGGAAAALRARSLAGDGAPR